MKLLVKFILGLAALLLVMVIAAVITVSTLDPNDHKDWISAKANEYTGRTLSLGGDLDLTFYPWLGVEANEVAVGNAPGFGEKPFLKADYLKLRVKLLPIFKEQYEVDTVIIRGAELNLGRNSEGTSNWDDLLADDKREDTGALPLAAVVLGGVDIQKASLNWNDLATDSQYEITNMDIKTDPLSYGDPLKLDVRMDLKANRPAIDGSIKLDGTIAYDIDNQLYNIKPLELVAKLKSENISGGETDAIFSAAIDLDLEADTAKVSDLELDVLDTQVRGALVASRIQTPGPSVQATIKVKGENLAQLFKVAEIEPLASQIASLSDRSFTLDTSIDADTERGDIDIAGLNLVMLGATVVGDVKARNMVSDTPEYEGKLNAAGPDLPTLLQVLGQFQGGSDSTLTRYGLTFAKGKHKAFRIDGNFDADMKSGNVDVSGLLMELLGAKVQGEVSARNMLSEKPRFKGKLKAAGPDLPTLLQVVGQAQGGGESSLTEYGIKFSRLKNKAFTINAGFDADMNTGNVDVPSIDIDALGIKVTGNLKAKDMQSDKGVVNGKLNIEGEKLGRLLKALEQKPLAKTLKSFSLKAGISGNANKVQLKPMALEARVAGVQAGEKPVKVSLNADTTINLKQEALRMAGLTLQGLGLNVSGSLEARKILQAPEFKGRINVAPFDLRSLATKLNQELPQTADLKVLRKIGIDTQFAGSSKNLDVEKLVLAIDETNLNGTFSVVDFENPAINFDIDIDEINADRYLPPSTDKSKPLTPETAAGAAMQLPVETLQTLNVNGKLTVGKLTISNAKLKKVKLKLAGKDGKITLAPVSARLYQGTYSGDIKIDASAKLPRLVINSALKGVNLAPLLRDTTGKADLAGKGTISLAAVARGSNTDAFKQTLNGQAELRVTNGVVRGVDIPGALEQVEIMIEQKRIGKINSEGNTPFESLTATLPINGGVINNNDLLLTAPGFSVTGSGVLARLSDNSWKYDLRAGVDERSVAQGQKRYNVGGYKVNIRCRGQIDVNNCKPDAFKLAGEALQKIFIDKMLPGSTPSAESQAADPNVDPRQEMLDKALKSIFK